MSEQTGSEFSIQRIYLKDASFESPRAPEVFLQAWKPKVNLEINTKHSRLENDMHEVVLIITASVKSENEETLYLAEVHQAGIFQAKGMTVDELGRALGSYCPAQLFPYAREAIDSMVVKGSFPPLVLAPVNFEAIYNETLRKRAEQKAH
ncbi:MAG: protein-export chaperone SecB [Gammaproteobacteria bacterium]|nr:protein-export chaperone SecB [Gammaproteobacteria bacterium]